MSLRPPRMDFVEYDPTYPRAFDQLTRTVRGVLPASRIEHVGSTSVHGLGGRGTLDVVLLSEADDHRRIIASLLAVGFTQIPYGAAQPALTCSANPAPMPVDAPVTTATRSVNAFVVIAFLEVLASDHGVQTAPSQEMASQHLASAD